MRVRRLVSALLAAMLTLLPAAAAGAEDFGIIDPIIMEPVIKDPVVKDPVIKAPTISLITLTGTLRYERELETPHFSLAGWALRYDDAAILRRLVGHEVTAAGTRFDGISILMRRQLEVSELFVTLEGDLRQISDVGIPHLELDGWVLLGEPGHLEALALHAGSRVRVSARVAPGPNLYMKPALMVQKSARLPDELPMLVVVSGRFPSWYEPPAIIDSRLMLPLRPIVETAGGSVRWDPVRRAVQITLGDRSTMVAIGKTAVEGGASLPVAPLIRNSQTLVPVETFVLIGLMPQRAGGVLSLSPAPVGNPAER